MTHHVWCRVLVVEHGDGLWGAQQYVLRLAPLMEERGVEQILAAPARTTLAEHWRASGRRHVDLPAPSHRSVRTTTGGLSVRAFVGEIGRNIASARRVARCLRATGADLVHTNSHWSHMEGVLGARLARRHVVLHLHEHSERDRIGQLRAAAVIAADAVIAVSDSVAGSLPKVARNRVEVIRNGIDPVRFAPGTPSAELRRQLRRSGDDPVVLALSRYEPTKGLEDLIRAIARLPDDLRHVRLVLAGGSKEEGSPFAQNLFDLARRLLGPLAQFLGFREDVCELLRVSDVCVLPSHIEGLGLVVLEAQATGCQVVASDTGGVPELIEHGVTGLLFPVGDVDRLAGAITSVLRDGDLRSRLSTNARQRVVDHSTLARQADAEVAVLRGVVGQRHRGVR